MISAVTAQGLLRFSTYTGSLTGARFIEFCRKLLADTDRPVYLVVDGHPTHRSKLVKEFIAATEGRLKLFVLPAYYPQLNPDEWVWKNVKHDRVGRTSVTGPDEFKTKVIGALRRLQKMPPHRPSVLRRPRPPLYHRMIRFRYPTDSLAIISVCTRVASLINHPSISMSRVNR
jgi:transposase